VTQPLLIATVAAVGVLHTLVPDHWAPIALLARQRKWSKAHTARVALQAGTGHVVTTLLLALVVWLAGVAAATRFGHLVDTLSSLALIGFGLWIAIGSWREIREPHEHHDQVEPRAHTSTRMALLLILGSSPMIEGIPAFFAASKYGISLIIPMAVLFAISTIATYVLLCIYSAVLLHNVKFAAFEKYGEVLSGGFIALLGLVFLIWPIL